MSTKTLLKDHEIVEKIYRRLIDGLSVIINDRSALISLIILTGFVFLGLFGPHLAPYNPIKDYVRDGGVVLRLAEPSGLAPMGTTQYGQDILSQFLTGARPTLIAVLIGGLGTSIVGFFAGLIAGYYGGWTDTIIMRFADLAFSLPLLPIAILILSFTESSIYIISIIIVMFMWKIPARVVRSETLTVKERTFVKAARASGASHHRVMLIQVAPSLFSIGVLYTAYSMAWAVIIQSGIAFLGFGDPTTTSWGRMIREAFAAGVLREAWWWVLPPAIGITAVSVSAFFIGRAYEEIINPEL